MRFSIIKKLWLIVGMGVLVLAVVLVAPLVKQRSGKSDQPRHTLSFSTPNLAPQISTMEARLTEKSSGADKALLAGLYVKQAKLTGDATWYDKAEAMAKASLEALPQSNTGAKLALAETLEKRHLFAQSLAIAKGAVKENPRNPEALAVFATTSLAVGDIDEASRTVDLAVSIHASTPLLTLRGLVLSARGRDAEADCSFRKALEVENTDDAPDASYTRAVYARFLITKGRYEEARTYVDEALRIVPGQHLALSISGDLYLKRKEPEKAAKDFWEAFAASPQVSYLRKISRAKKMVGDQRASDDAMREALALARREITSGVHAHPLELGYALIAGSDPEGWKEAVQAATDELKIRRSVLPYVVLAQAQEKAKNWEAATEAINSVLRSGVRNPDYFMTAAKIAKGSGDVDRARLYFEAALAEDRNLTEAEEGIKELGKKPVEKPFAQRAE